MLAAHLPFNLRFAAIPANDCPATQGRPHLRLTPPSAGWMRWHFNWPASATVIELSYIFRLDNIWFWSVAVAHRLLPVTLVIDQEGVLAELCAEWGDIERGRLRLTLRHIDEDDSGKEYGRYVWFDDRARWLRRLGHVFGNHMNANFDAKAWHCGSPLWTEPTCFLPWDWPGHVAPWTESSWPQEKLHAWFFAMIALALAPYGKHFGCVGEDGEKSARLRFQFANLRKEAAVAALRVLELEIPAESEKARAAAQTLIDLFEETDYPDEPLDRHRTAEDEKQLPPTMQRHNRLLLACANMEEQTRPTLQVIRNAAKSYPLQPGLWIRDENMRAGRLLERHGQWWIVDWGLCGFNREHGLVGGGRHSWRWPVVAAEDFEAPVTPLFRRWRAFALAEQTWGYLICPCCGYPHLEEEDIEIEDCPICGWPLFLLLRHRLIEPDRPLSDDLSGDWTYWPALAESRQFFEAHGDAYSPDGHTHTQWLRRPDVIELRRQVRVAFDDWLTMSKADSPLPVALWQKLEWMPRGEDEED
jgi:hypothetical protein